MLIKSNVTRANPSLTIGEREAQQPTPPATSESVKVNHTLVHLATGHRYSVCGLVGRSLNDTHDKIAVPCDVCEVILTARAKKQQEEAQAAIKAKDEENKQRAEAAENARAKAEARAEAARKNSNDRTEKHIREHAEVERHNLVIKQLRQDALRRGESPDQYEYREMP